MNTPVLAPDPAAIFGAAKSLYDACHEHAQRHRDLNLSETFNGIDQLMRDVMRIAIDFETWSCAHIDFDRLSDVWPYFLEDKFGTACLSIVALENLPNFNPDDSLRIAFRLGLPITCRRPELDPKSKSPPR